MHRHDSSSLNEVRAFWESSPLFVGESDHESGTLEFFEHHRQIVIEDSFVGQFDERMYPPDPEGDVLDLGCGPMFWTTEFLINGKAKDIVAADLTFSALKLGLKRLRHYKVSALPLQANAEALPFKGESFDHVNCQGVIHHTPDTMECVREIARVLRPGGTASLSVYYRNIVLRNWSWLCWSGKIFGALGASLPGRGREGIFSNQDADDIVRLYDGGANPIGKAYTRNAFLKMLAPYFHVKEVHYHYFPARTLPFRIPKFIHRWLDRRLPFMICTTLEKKE